MAWDEKLFHFFYTRIKKSSIRRFVLTDEIKFIEVQRSSEVFLSALCECPIEIRASTSWGGWQARVLFIPGNFSFLPTRPLQEGYWRWRLLVAALDRSTGGLRRSSESFIDIVREFSDLETLIDELRPFLDPLGIKAWLGEGPRWDSEETKSTESDLFLPGDSESFASVREYRGRTEDRSRRVELKERPENPLTHIFEKVMTAEDYQGGQRPMDGGDEIVDHADALDEIRLSHVLRTRQMSQSVLKTDSLVESTETDTESVGIASPGTKVFYYPEWIERRKRYQEKWCAVFERNNLPKVTPIPFDRQVSADLRARLETCFSSFQWVARQKDGTEFDLPMVIDRFVQSHVTGPVIDNIYQYKIKWNHDFALQILVDTSLSADSYVLGKRVIELEQEALNIFSDAFKDIFDAISIAGFSSETRHQIHYDLIKDFYEPWDEVCGKIAALKPDGYTRIGPVLRHARYRLGQVRARKKLLLVLSDAKPTDYDFYEGVHGLADVQRATGELYASGIQTKVLTLTEKKYSHHNRIFGAQNCLAFKDVRELTQLLFQFWQQAIR